MPASSSPVLIIGGGIGGLAAALALLQRGLDAVVYEQAGELKEIGAGIQIGSNGTCVLHAMGLTPALKRAQVTPSRRCLRHWRTGETWDWYELGAASVQRYGTPHILMHRNDLHGILLDAVCKRKADAIKLGMRCAALTQTADEVTVRFAGGGAATGAFVVGADGVHSQVRKILFGADVPEFAGCVAWRGLV
ncbi:MAG: FAD-dependent monooxygenase, partial [Pseudomonadota bacterium]